MLSNNSVLSTPLTKENETEVFKTSQKDLLEPQFYPDPNLFRNSLKMTKDDEELMLNITSNKATIRVLAPYLKVMRKAKKRLIQSVTRKKEATPEEDQIRGRKSKDQLIRTIPELSDQVELVVSIHETADVLRLVLNANFVVTYFVDLNKNEIYQSPRHIASSRSKISWKIELGTTMAAYAASTKQYVTSKNLDNDIRFPLGLGYPGSIMKYGLCVPIKTPDNKVVAVYELSRDAFQSSFEPQDVQIVLAIAGWIGSAVLQNVLYRSVVRHQEISDYLLQLTNHYHAGKVTFDKTLTDIVMFARETIGAERGNIYVVNRKSKGRVVLEEYEQGVDYSRGLFKRRTQKYIEKDETLLSRAVFGQEVVDDTQDMKQKLDADAVRSVLCAPIVCHGETMGVIQLTNKKRAAHFDDEDKKTLQIFATFCVTNLNYLQVYDKQTKSDLQIKVLNEMLFHHIQPCSHDQEVTEKCSNSLPDNFFSFTWYPSVPDDTPKLIEYTINVFHEVLGDKFMSLNDVPNFVLTVKNCYRSNPYHNYLHAFCVTHAMANIMVRYHNFFTGLERKSLMVASLCHDVDHRGYNNNFVQLTRHHLAGLYESSPLENHHYAVTRIILRQCGIFKYVSPDIYKELMEEIYELIIATDLSLYFQCRMELLKVADEKAFTFKNTSHRRLVKSMMMTACDLAGQTKLLPVSQGITEDVYEEFYQQGDVEKKMGYIPLPTMDRNKHDMIPENQVQFLSVVVLPCVETVSKIFSSLSPMVWEVKLLLTQWKKMTELKDKYTWKPDESFGTVKTTTPMSLSYFSTK